MSPWIIVFTSFLLVYAGLAAWYLRKAFPNSELELQFRRWKETLRWGSCKKKDREIS
jgi:hypothetical protein